MGIVADVVRGAVALVGLIVGGLIAAGLSSAVVVPYFGAVVGLVGLPIAGYGLRRRSVIWAFAAGFGLGIAIPIATLVFQLTIR